MEAVSRIEKQSSEHKDLHAYSVPKMLFPNYHDPVLFINFLAQAVVPVMSAKQTDILLHVFVNI